MKLGPNFFLLRGPAATGTTPQRSPRPSPTELADGGVILISRENRRAWQSVPKSLQKAQEVLQRVMGHLAEVREDALAEVHQLKARCLVKLS